jgi:VCBS repeat-containing protein
MRTARSKRSVRSRRASRSDRFASPRRSFTRACGFETLESRNLLSGTSLEARLSIYVDSERVEIPSSITGSVGSYTEDDGALTVQADSSVTLADLFEGWNVDDSTASLSATQLMGNVADATSTVQMFVNGEVSTEFQNHVLAEGDEIVLVYGSDPVVSLNTNYGPIVIELFKAATPGTVANFLNYVNDGDYLNTIFHRSDPDFVIQGGGYSTTSTYFSSTDQFSSIDTDDAIENEPGISNLRGTVAMAKLSGDADSATSQFFVNLADNSFLDSEDYDSFTVFANVLDMTTVDTIASLTVDTSNSSPFAELPVGDDGQLVVIQSIEGLGSLTGTKFYDADGDGVFDASESGISGVTVYIDANNNGSYDSGEISTTTDSSGDFLLQIEPGTYTVRAGVTSGYTETLPVSSAGHSVTTVIGETISALDFGESSMSAPSSVDLVAGTDSGTSSTDNVTNFNNASASAALKFLVSGLLDGATVYLYCDGTLIGTGTASGNTATVTTNGTTTLSDGSHSFTAKQSLSGITSDSSSSMAVTVDATAPSALASTPSATAQIGVAYTFDADCPQEGESGLVYSLNDEPDGMAINAGTGVISWTPSDDQAVPQLFEIVVTDLAGNATTTSVDMTVYGTIPAEADSYTVTEDASLTVGADTGVLVNDGDDDSGTLTAELVSSPSHGTLSFDADGSFTYTPYDDYSGTDTFTYRASDGENETNVAKVTITVTAVNDSPTGTADTYTVAEDVTLTVNAASGVLANDTDPDGDALTVTLSTDVSNGTLSLSSDGSFTYVPDANFNGTDTFTYILSDGSVTIDSITATITVTSVDDAPTGVADSYSATEDVTLTVNAASGVLANDSDVEGDSVTATLSDEPSNGTVTFSSDGSFTYVPDANFYGTDTFTYTATDGTNVSSEITVTITVSGVADAPTAVADSYSVNEGSSSQSFDVLDNDSSDPDGTQTLTISSVTQGVNGGTVVINGSAVEYTPEDGYVGTDTFTYTITDTDGLTATATVTVTVSSASNSLAGYVYLDGDGDGTMDSDESGIPGVLITLAGTDGSGNSVSRTAITSGDGSFSFTGLPSGTYQLTESQPCAMLDGSESTEITDAVTGSDEFTGITLSNDGSGVCYFGESGLKPAHISARQFLASTPAADEYLAEIIALAEDIAGNTELAAAIRDGKTTLDNANTPVAVADSYSVDTNATLTIDAASGVLANDSDGDGDNLTAVLVSNVSHGTLTLSDDGSFSYVPATDYAGSDSFTYQASDGSLTSGTVKVTITVGAASTTNTAPTVVADTYSATEDNTLTVAAASGVLANDSDVDEDSLTVTLVTDASNGTLSLSSDGSFTYTPDEDYTGTDAFTYQNSDGLLSSNTVTVTITISASNSAPSAVSDTYALDEDEAFTVDAADGVLANDTDPDGDTLTATLMVDASYGTLVLSADGSFTYTPDEDFHGTDTFGYQASDGDLATETCYVTLTVATVGDAPEAVADSYRIAVDAEVTVDAEVGVLANDTDPDGDTLTASLVTSPANGTLSMNSDGSFTYTPNEGFQGTDTFIYTASDGALSSAETTVTIYVNTLATVAADSYTVDEDGSLTIDASSGVLANDSDADGDTLTAAIATEPGNGTVTINADGSFTYTPDEDFNGTDTFTYTANDGCEDSGEATVTITVNSLEDAPEAVDDSYRTAIGAAFTVDASSGVLANDSDADGDGITATLVTSPEHGTLALSSDGAFTYTPDSSYHGLDAFTYTTTDDTGLSDTATVTIAMNSLSAAAADSYTVDEDGSLTIDASSGVLANDSDGDGDSMTVTLITTASNGSLSLNSDGSFVYTPAANFNGTDTFVYVANDGYENSVQTTVTITVAAIADAPAAADDSYSTAIDEMLTVDADGGVLANDSDADGDSMAVVVVDNPAHGTLSLATDGSFTYSPESGYQGVDTFTYTATDGVLVSEETTVTINVNSALTTAEDEYVVNEDNTLTVDVSSGVLANDSDVDGDTLTVTLVSSTQHGALSLNVDGSFSYTPAADFNGTDTFVYTASDGLSESADTTVTITVQPQADAPVVTGDTYRTPVDETLAVAASSGVLVNDSDVDGDSLTPSVVSGPAHGTVNLAADGSFTYTPESGFQGTDSFTYTVTDGGHVSAAATVTVEVNALPQGVADSYSVDEDGALTIAATAGVLVNDSDADGDTLTVTLVTGTSHGTLTLSADGSFTYWPVSDFYGTDTFVYTVSDGTASSADTTVTITVAQISQVRFSLELVDESGAAVSAVTVGDTVVMNVYVQDIRSDAEGVGSAFLDVLYDSDLLSVVSVAYGEDFPSDQNADTTTTAGVIDEAGASTGGTASASPSAKHLLYSVTFTANTAGTAEFESNLAENHDVLLTGLDDSLAGDKIIFDFASLEIAGASTYGSAADVLFQGTDDWLGDLT